ncbi:MAG TPA: lysozyme inhibitor LprI family protein [Caulobacteraceae bacterium]
MAASTAARAACPGETQMEMNACAAATLKAADAKLAVAYAKLDPTPQRQAAELAWIAYRDAECRYEASVYQGGSIQPMVLANCMAERAKARTAELTALAAQEPFQRRR